MIIKLDLQLEHNSKENFDESLVEEQVSQDTRNFVKSSPNVDKETVFPVNKKIEFSKPKNHEKPVKKSVRYAEMYRSQSPKGNQRNWNGQKSNQLGKDFVMYNKDCFICGSFNHLQINCDNHQRRGIVSRNNHNRVHAKNTHPSVLRNMSPKAVLLKIGLTPLNTVRPVNIAHPKTAVHSAKSKTHFSKQAQSTAKRPFYRRFVHAAKRQYYTGRAKAVNTPRSYTGQVNVVMVKGGKPQHDDKGFVDSGCSRHMTGNIAYLSDFKEFDGGYVAFRGGIWSQVPRYHIGDVNAQTRFEIASKQSNNPPLSRGYTLGSGEDSMKLLELMEFCAQRLSELKNRKRDFLLLVYFTAAKLMLGLVNAIMHMLMLPVQVPPAE
ncbi:hypothetical protein Tco_1445320, partial [Tanacetum coccineum]